MWLAPELLFDDANTITDGSSDTPDSEIARQVQQFASDTQIIAKGILDTLKYVLLAAAIGAIALMRIRPCHLLFLTTEVAHLGCPSWFIPQSWVTVWSRV